MSKEEEINKTKQKRPLPVVYLLPKREKEKSLKALERARIPTFGSECRCSNN